MIALSTLSLVLAAWLGMAPLILGLLMVAEFVRWAGRKVGGLRPARAQNPRPRQVIALREPADSRVSAA